jgi:hypothetical protein
LNCCPILVNADFSEAAAITTIFPVACGGWEFELQPTIPVDKPATSIVDTELPKIPIPRMRQTLTVALHRQAAKTRRGCTSE